MRADFARWMVYSTKRKNMKRISIVAMAVLAASFVACNQASAGGSFNQQARIDSLEKKVTEMEANMEAVAYILEKRAGMSLEDAKKEMEEANKVWDIPVDDSPVFGNTKDPKLTIVEFTTSTRHKKWGFKTQKKNFIYYGTN